MKTSNTQHPTSSEVPSIKLQAVASKSRCSHNTASAPHVQGQSPKASGPYSSLGFGAFLVVGGWLLIFFLPPEKSLSM
jgi:hypothetical protein